MACSGVWALLVVPLLELFAGFSLESLLFTIAPAAMTTVLAVAEVTGLVNSNNNSSNGSSSGRCSSGTVSDGSGGNALDHGAPRHLRCST